VRIMESTAHEKGTMAHTLTATPVAARAVTSTDDRPINPRVVAIAALLLLGGVVYLQRLVDWRHAALYLVGALAGVALYHAAFGFTSPWRVFVSDRRSGGLRAQMLMLALACALFIPLLASGTEMFGQPLRGAVAPVGVSVVVGAFLFGLGMQLGGGCASGTLYTAGGGNTRMVVTLLFFIVGSVVGTAHVPYWHATPSLGAISLVDSAGAFGALGMSLGAFAVIALGAAALERRRHGTVAPLRGRGEDPGRWLYGPWPIVWGAVALVVVNVATLLLAGRPWGVTSAFALWGAKSLAALGVDITSWEYWSTPGRIASLEAPVLTDTTSVMNIGILLGALTAAGLRGRFRPVWRVPIKSLTAAVIGGLLLGYGARLAYGCNIGAYFSGVSSASLHGWLWFASAGIGTVAGTYLRPFFGMVVERTPEG